MSTREVLRTKSYLIHRLTASIFCLICPLSTHRQSQPPLCNFVKSTAILHHPPTPSSSTPHHLNISPFPVVLLSFLLQLMLSPRTTIQHQHSTPRTMPRIRVFRRTASPFCLSPSVLLRRVFLPSTPQLTSLPSISPKNSMLFSNRCLSLYHEPYL